MMSNSERLAYMANQIARNFEALGQEAAAAATAEHIGLFWDPRMRAQIFAQFEAGGGALSPVAAAAVSALRDKAAREGFAREGHP